LLSNLVGDSVLALHNYLLTLATFKKEFFIKEDILSTLMEMIICFLNRPFVVILMWGFGLLWPLTMLFTWLIFWAFKEGNISLIFKTSDVLAEGFDAYVYDLLDLSWGVWDLFSTKVFLGWKYLERTLISFLDFAGREKRGGALLIVTETNFGISFLLFPLVVGVCRVNFEEILALSELVFWLV